MTRTLQPRIGSLFSGYRGLDMAVEAVTGGRTVWVSDVDEGANRLLAAHCPSTPNLGDIRDISWFDVQPVDILTGGFPCQDVAQAGRKAGLIRYGSASNRSGLWAQMAGAIDILRPRLVVAENVRGLVTGKSDTPGLAAIDAVIDDLHNLGYAARWHGVRASDVGAPHQRYRVFIVAWPFGERPQWDGSPRIVPFSRAGKLLPTPEAKLATSGPDYARMGRPRSGGPDLTTALHLLPLDGPDRWGPYAAAVELWEQLTGAAPAARVEGSHGGFRTNPAFVEWMMGLPRGHVTDVGLTRTEQLRALGNGVVPAQAEYALRSILAAAA